MKMENAKVVNEFVSMEQYPYAVCVMIIGPFDPTYVISGDAEKVHAYWNSQMGIDYKWYQYKTELTMQSGIKEITSKHTNFSHWMLFHVEDCPLKETPPNEKGRNLGNPPGTDKDEIEYKTKNILSWFSNNDL